MTMTQSEDPDLLSNPAAGKFAARTDVAASEIKTGASDNGGGVADGSGTGPPPPPPPAREVPKASWGRLNTALVALSVVGGAAWYWNSFSWDSDQGKLWYWLSSLVILGLFTLGVGHALTGTWKSLLIDDRNKVSLSRLQLALWTGLVLSTYATVVVWNRTDGSPNPLNVPMPQELWILLGISTASLVGSNLIKSDQEKKPSVLDTPRALPASVASKKRAIVRALAAHRQVSEGQLAANEKPEQARWTDIFKGEGVDNFTYLDLGKVQLFFFTVILVLLYATAVGSRFDGHTRDYTGEHATVENLTEAERAARGQDEFEFPDFDEAMVALLGISHAGYLANKAAKQPGTG